MVRKLRKSPDTRARLPEAYSYPGSSADADAWVATLTAETGRFAHPPAGAPLTASAPRRTRRRRRPHLGDVADSGVDLATGINPGGGGGGGSLLDADEFALVILAVIAVVLVAAIAVPLGLIAIEVVLTLGAVAAGVVLRLARVKPWTVLMLRDGAVVAAIAVKGWRASRAVIAALRLHTA